MSPEQNQFVVRISTRNAAFENADGEPCAFMTAHEVARIMRELADTIETTEGLAHVLRDVNGNRVGASGRDRSSARG
tara:strand:- start:164 stop:394 length:231 start_codon:yes stop_codon:yes gene_type:complete